MYGSGEPQSLIVLATESAVTSIIFLELAQRHDEAVNALESTHGRASHGFAVLN